MIFVAPDIPCSVPETCNPAHKEPGNARFVFISRICKMKNPDLAIEAISKVPGAELDIYGPIEEPFDLCGHYRGILSPAEVIPTLQRGHFFILPTRGENFGHVIFESLAAGCPPILSTNTPWGDLMEQEAGWMLPLSMPDVWHDVISLCVAMAGDEYSDLSRRCHSYAKNWSSRNLADKYRSMFKSAAQP